MKSIHLLAKEVAATQASIQAHHANSEEIAGDSVVSSSSIGKQIAELYAQMRKLTTDVFEQVKSLKTSPQEQQAKLEREREAVRT